MVFKIIALLFNDVFKKIDLSRMVDFCMILFRIFRLLQTEGV